MTSSTMIDLFIFAFNALKMEYECYVQTVTSHKKNLNDIGNRTALRMMRYVQHPAYPLSISMAQFHICVANGKILP